MYPAVRLQVFVDEYTCIGCRNCTNVCPKCVTLLKQSQQQNRTACTASSSKGNQKALLQTRLQACMPAMLLHVCNL